MAAPLTKHDIHRRVDTRELLVMARRGNPDPSAQAQTYAVVEERLISLVGDLYEDIAAGQ